MTDAEVQRFKRHLRRDESTGCLNWTAFRDRQGYGSFRVRRGSGGKTYKSHRVAFVLGGGILTADKPCVLHRCDNPSCCEITHLFAGNTAINLADMARKGRGLKSKVGHPFGATPNQGAFQSQVTIEGKCRYLGRYATWQEASAIAFLHKNLSLYPDLGVN